MEIRANLSNVQVWLDYFKINFDLIMSTLLALSLEHGRVRVWQFLIYRDVWGKSQVFFHWRMANLVESKFFTSTNIYLLY